MNYHQQEEAAGGVPGAHPAIAVTMFDDKRATRLRVEQMTLVSLRDRILTTTARTKDALPLLKLATFGDRRTARGSLRANDNVESISGVELDYDAEEMGFFAATRKLQDLRLRALVYTSPSHAIDRSRWRILLPTSRPLPPEERKKLVARANGALGGIFGPESFTLSQAFYFGRALDNQAADHRAEIIEGDFIDLRKDLARFEAMGSTRSDDARHHATVHREPPVLVIPEYLAALIEADAGKGLSTDPDDGWAPASREKILAALAAIDPDADRATWFNVGCALFSECGEEEGLELWEGWSARGKKYPGPRGIARQWESITCGAGYSKTIGTLFFHADEANPDWRRQVEEAEPPVGHDDQHAEAPEANDDRGAARQNEKGDERPRNYELVRASDVVMRAKRWLWQGHLLRGSLELLTGIPGLGKSQVQLSMIAAATTGGRWPDGSAGCEPVNVVMLTAEDALDDEVVPRLHAAKADLGRVSILRKIRRDKLKRMFLLSEDIEELANVVRDVGGVGLVTLDPITAYMGKINSHNTTDVRGQLGPLAEMAERTQVAFSAITHPPKATSQKAIDHFIGSQAFIAAARVGHLCVGEVDEDGKPTGRVLFTNAKNNVSQPMPSLAYRVHAVTVGKDPETGTDIVSPYAAWQEGAVKITSDQAVAASNGSGGRPGRTDDARAFLESALAAGPVGSNELFEQARAHGLSPKQLRYVQKALKIRVRKDGMGGGWVWEIGL